MQKNKEKKKKKQEQKQTKKGSVRWAEAIRPHLTLPFTPKFLQINSPPGFFV